MSDTAYQTQFRQEFVKGFEQRQSLLRTSVTTEVMVKGNTATFLVADSGGARAVTRGTNGRIPGRPDNLNQYSATLVEWHDVPERTGFNLFASQGDGRRIMQETAMAVINRQIDQDILNALANATYTTGASTVATLNLVLRAKTILGVNKVPADGNITAVISPAFMAYLHMIEEFENSLYVERKPLDSGDAFWKDSPGYYKWLGVNWVETPMISGVGTNTELCYMYHRSAIGHAAPSELIQTYADYDKRDDFSYCRCTAYMGPKLLQAAGVVLMRHDGSALVTV